MSGNKGLPCPLLAILGAFFPAPLLVLGACAPEERPSSAPFSPEVELDIAWIRRSAQSYDRFVKALVLCGSESPTDWVRAMRDFDEIHPFHLFKDDPEIIRRFKAGETVARRELARRGKILEAQAVFFGPYDSLKWSQARGTLMESAPEVLVWTLLQALLNAQYQKVWMHVRYNLVQAGEPALRSAGDLARELARKAPDTPIFPVDDLTQILMVLVEFGERGGPLIEEFSRHPSNHVRRAVGRAIGEARDVAGAPILTRLLEDGDWGVRVAAAQAMGRLGAGRRIVGPALVARIGKESDRTVLRTVLEALGECHYSEAVPDLMGVLEVPSREVVTAAMGALYHITGEKLNAPSEWREWYRTKYPAWERRRPP